MDNTDLVASFSEFAKRKNVDRPTMIRILEDVFRVMIRKKYGTDEGFEVIINTEKGDLEIWRVREIVDDNSEDIWDLDKISLQDAQAISTDFEIGEEVSEEISLESFGRRAISMARQALIQKIRNLEKEVLFNKYKDLVGSVITVEVYQVLNHEVLFLDVSGNELSLPRGMQIPKDKFRRSEQLRALIHSVEMEQGIPRIILSRTSPVFLERLFESEVPEVHEGTITIKKIVRDPGERAKVVVESYDDRIDPVGACVGIKGSRIHGIVRELCGESIDVINHTDNLQLYITRSLSPAKISSMEIDKEKQRVDVYLRVDQVSLALGKKGQNIRLASRLLEMEIEVYRENIDSEDEDVALKEFADEIDQWIIDEFRKIGLDTAKMVLAVSKDELVQRTDLEEGTVDEVLKILENEFEQG